jgi:hypothetical protein
MSQEFNEIFENLEEGIVYVQNKSIKFANQIFKDIVKNATDEKSSQSTNIHDMLNLKIFKVHRNEGNSSNDNLSDNTSNIVNK